MALTFGGISYVDVVQASKHIQNGILHGIKANYWQRPITHYGVNFAGWKETLLNSNTGNIEISQQNWKSSARIVDAVMHLFLKGLRYHASEYNGLVIEQYITQGSARDGLKVIAADEFDTMIFFRISELWKYIDPIRDKKDPSFCRMKVVGLTGSQIQQRFPRLCKERVFIITHSGDIYLSAKAMHEQVFKSIIDKTIAIINSLETAWINEFQLTRKMNPPAINIIVRNHSATRSIAIDFVPAVCIDMQSVKFRGSVRKFPVFAVCKWQGKRDSYCHTWSVKSNSYENALINAARKDERGLFVLNALRLVKTFFQNAKTMNPPPQIGHVLKTYHLKQIMLYLLGFLCYKYTSIPIDGTEAALIYFVRVMDMVLTYKCLPHLFFSDVGILQNMIPGCNLHRGRDINLLVNLSSESACQAVQDLELKLMPAIGISWVNKCNSEQDNFCKDFITNVLKIPGPHVMKSTVSTSQICLQEKQQKQLQQQEQQEQQQKQYQQQFLTRRQPIRHRRSFVIPKLPFAEQWPRSQFVDTLSSHSTRLNELILLGRSIITTSSHRYHPYSWF
ncbi:uncharacterized protein LOC128245151 isoform X1 [Mya arenaria]|uniref:uncharacterized protein LOC128245151 isoform X1 n=1 Tax=Mya arenaria TaxID=6604 RepID=UPI0022E40AF6|nr:uncharacterized protein LOC128245151 isoform X1 [Mya arenaria]